MLVRMMRRMIGPLRNSRLSFVPLCLALGVGAAFAQGGPPMLTDDPGTPGPGHWEINLALSQERTSVERATDLPILDLNYGVGDRIQLNYGIAWGWQSSDSGHSVDALENSQFAMKWRFLDQGDDGWKVSMFPRVILRNPGSRAARLGLDDDGTTFFLPFEFEHDVPGGALNFEVGHEFHSRGDDAWVAGAVFGHEFRKGVEGMAELHGDTSSGWVDSSLMVNFGLVVDFDSSGSLLLSAGREVHAPNDSSAAWLAYGGWQLTF